MRIQHNISALNSYRQMGGNNNALSKNLEKLSSGYRINRAGDDAAGLAISEKMRSQIKGLETAQKNANDGISLVQTAEGALTEVHSMLNRMTELATQSANGTYDNEVDRANLQKEVEALIEEIDRISESTNFNGINLLDGSLGGSGTSGNDLIGGKIIKFKAAESTCAGGDASGNAITSFAVKDTLMIDGTEVEVDWSRLTEDEQSALKVKWTDASTTLAQTKEAASILEKTINDAIDRVNKETGGSVNHITVQATTAGNFKVKSGLQDSNESELKVKGQASLVLQKVLGQAAGTANVHAALGTGGTATEQLMIDPSKANGKIDMLIDGEKIEVVIAGLAAGDAGATIAGTLDGVVQTALGNYDTAKGLTGGDALAGKIKVTFNDEGRLEVINTTEHKIGFADKDGNDYAKTLGLSASGKALAAGGLTLQIGDTADDFNKLTLIVDSMDANSLGIGNIDISSQEGAAAAVDKIKNAINKVSSTRGDLGAAQNRLEHTINNLGVTTENITAAESRIRDTDMASEMMQYTKNNILIQASQAMLAQANQVPQGVLQLLQ